MEPLLTPRLRLRNFRSTDAAALSGYRNDPTTAEYQSWQLPFTSEQALELASELAEAEAPSDGEWFGLAITESGSQFTPDKAIGDVVVRLEWSGRSAEIGYSLAREHRGKGYATEATSRLIEWLFIDLGVQRIHAAFHPDNLDSMMLLERLGFVHEGLSRQSFWVGDVCSDDRQFGLVRANWDAWRGRPRSAPSLVELAEVTPQNRRAVFALATHPSQERFVSTMAKSAADALVVDLDDGGGEVVPWFRAIVADGVIVGFVMVAEPTTTNPDPYLWRLLIDRTHQRRGIGWQVLNLIAERYRAEGYRQLIVSWSDGRGSPRPMYERFGFVPTGAIEHGETVAILDLTRTTASSPTQRYST